jgi:hypothetical protein
LLQLLALQHAAQAQDAHQIGAVEMLEARARLEAAASESSASHCTVPT